MTHGPYQHGHHPQSHISPYAGPPAQVAPKSTAAALVMSLFIPGLGSMYAGKPWWGILILALWLISWPLAFVLIGLVTLPLTWVWGMYAGYADARAWNRAHGIIS